jgi:nickel/cobalt exporter
MTTSPTFSRGGTPTTGAGATRRPGRLEARSVGYYGRRPAACSGAIILLVFALSQGLFWAGVVSTFVMGMGTAVTVAAIATIAVSAKAFARRFASHKTGYGGLLVRGMEVGAAALVLMFGILLLAGYMASERLVGF